MKKVMSAFLAVCIVLSAFAGLGGCSLITKRIMNKEDALSMQDATGIFTEATTEAIAVPETTAVPQTTAAPQTTAVPETTTDTEMEFPAYQETLYFLENYNGLTTGDVTYIWGDGYTVGNYLWGGGSKPVYYTDGRCPIIFYFACRDVNVSHITGTEPLQMLSISPDSNTYNYYIDNKVCVTMTYSQISRLVSGEFYENMMDGGYCFTYTTDKGSSVIFEWHSDNVETTADLVRIAF